MNKSMPNKIGPSRLAFLAMIAGGVLETAQLIHLNVLDKTLNWVKSPNILGSFIDSSQYSNKEILIISLFAITFIVCTPLSYGWFRKNTTVKIVDISSRLKIASWALLMLSILSAICYGLFIQIFWPDPSLSKVVILYFGSKIAPILLQGISAVGGLFFSILIFSTFGKESSKIEDTPNV